MDNGIFIEDDQERRVTILLIDDDKLDRKMIRRSLKASAVKNAIVEVQNGHEAFEFIQANTTDCRLNQPYLILLDINMPKMDGFEFLKIMASFNLLDQTTIFVLSTSLDPDDLTRSIELGAETLIGKNKVARDMSAVLEILSDQYKIVSV